MSSKTFNPFKDFQPDQMQRSSVRIFTTHSAYFDTSYGERLTDSFFQIVNSVIESFWGKLDLLWLLTLDFACLLFYLQYRPVQTDAPATGAANIGGLN